MNYWHLTLPSALVTLDLTDARYAARSTQQGRKQVVQLHDGELREAVLKLKARDAASAQAISARVRAIGNAVFKIALPVDGVYQYATARITGSINQAIDAIGTEFSMPLQLIGVLALTEADRAAFAGETADSRAFFTPYGYFEKLTRAYIS